MWIPSPTDGSLQSLWIMESRPCIDLSLAVKHEQIVGGTRKGQEKASRHPEDALRFADYNTERESTIHLALRILGGMRSRHPEDALRFADHNTERESTIHLVLRILGGMRSYMNQPTEKMVW
uniref:PSD1 domain-containing protein n=1 Tax=Ascaris lumbricoides TaxID=6252 RepID=A0A0M3IS91_ASCLU